MPRLPMLPDYSPRTRVPEFASVKLESGSIAIRHHRFGRTAGEESSGGGAFG